MEIIVAVIVIGLLVGVLLPQLGRTKRTTQLSQCEKNLKEVVLAHLLWVNDHERAVFPGQISTNDGGTKEYLQRGEMFRHFQLLSNELFDPALPLPVDLRVLVCPADDRQGAKSFVGLTNSNLSYFVNGGIGRLSGTGIAIDPPHESIGYIVLGDRNITNSSGQKGGVVTVDKNQQAGWSWKMHNRGRSKSSVGNVAYADGSISNLTSAQLQTVINVPDECCWFGSSFPLFVP